MMVLFCSTYETEPSGFIVYGRYGLEGVFQPTKLFPWAEGELFPKYMKKMVVRLEYDGLEVMHKEISATNLNMKKGECDGMDVLFFMRDAYGAEEFAAQLKEEAVRETLTSSCTS